MLETCFPLPTNDMGTKQGWPSSGSNWHKTVFISFLIQALTGQRIYLKPEQQKMESLEISNIRDILATSTPPQKEDTSSSPKMHLNLLGRIPNIANGELRSTHQDILPEGDKTKYKGLQKSKYHFLTANSFINSISSWLLHLFDQFALWYWLKFKITMPICVVWSFLEIVVLVWLTP